MSEQKIPYKIYLSENEIPEAWYNVRADMKVKPAPLLNPGTGQPMTAEELGILIVVNTSIGMITPPMGVNLFVACGLSGQSLESVSKKLLPYLLAEVIVLLAISYFPIIISALPRAMGLM